MEHLEGKKIKVKYPTGELLDCVVSGVEYSVGITVEALDTPNNRANINLDAHNFDVDGKRMEVYCIHGESSPHNTSPNYDTAFKAGISCIEASIFSLEEYLSLTNTPWGGGASNLDCAFK